MRRRQAILTFLAAAVLSLSLLTVFAIELGNTQAKSKRDVEARVHERTVLAAALLDSVFQSVQQALPQYERTYGTRTVANQLMDAHRDQSDYLALLDANHRVLANSLGFTAQARQDLRLSAALPIVDRGGPYGLGNVLPYGRAGVINFAVAIPTPFGKRILLSGSRPAALTPFLVNELRRIPGVEGAHNYVLDGNGRVLASTNPAVPAGYVFHTPGQMAVLSHWSGDVKGHYYDKVGVGGSTWRIVLAAPDGPLFASVSGLRKWLPWLVFCGFAGVALLAFALAWRLLHTADELTAANGQLGRVNAELERVAVELSQSNGQLVRQARELERSNAELEQFASIASHDLQEPLRKVRTFTDLLLDLESERLSEKGADYLRRTNAAAARMQTLISDLLKLSQVGTSTRPFTLVDLETLTREVLDDLDAQVLDTGAEIRLGGLPKVEADAPQMRQLMQNLLSNALKFRREGVTPEIEIDATVEKGKVRLMVRDNGIGFEPEYARRIFRAFERLGARGAYPGTGIGLAVCRKIAERHGGSIVAEGVPGVGATFTVTLRSRHRRSLPDPPAGLERRRTRPREQEHAYATV